MKRTAAKSTQSSRRLHSSCEYDSGVVSIAVYHTSKLHAQPYIPAFKQPSASMLPR